MKFCCVSTQMTCLFLSTAEWLPTWGVQSTYQYIGLYQMKITPCTENIPPYKKTFPKTWDFLYETLWDFRLLRQQFKIFSTSLHLLPIKCISVSHEKHISCKDSLREAKRQKSRLLGNKSITVFLKKDKKMFYYVLVNALVNKWVIPSSFERCTEQFCEISCNCTNQVLLINIK